MEDYLNFVQMEDDFNLVLGFVGMQPYFDPTRWNMEDDLIFFNRRRPYVIQMEDYLNFVLGNLGRWFSVCNLILPKLDEIWKMTSLFEMIDNPILCLFLKTKSKGLFRWKITLIFCEWKITSKYVFEEKNSAI